MSVSRRIFYACLATLLVLVLSVVYRLSTVEPVNDLYFPFCGAKALLHGIDPYGGRCLIKWKGVIYPPNPMTTIFAAVPFMVAFGAGWGALLLWSSFTGLLVFGLLCDGQWWRLLVLLSAPYWVAFLTLQWSPLVLAIALLPSLLPLALVKPHTGIPIILTNLTWRRALMCGLFLLTTFAVDTTWPLRWLPQTHSYDGYIPLLVFPVGLLLLLVLLRWREKSAQFLFLMAIVPQRGIYDLLSLWVLPETPKQLLILTGLSWVAYGLWALGVPLALPFLSVTLIYLPLSVLILQPPSTEEEGGMLN